MHDEICHTTSATGPCARLEVGVLTMRNYCTKAITEPDGSESLFACVLQMAHTAEPQFAGIPVGLKKMSQAMIGLCAKACEKACAKLDATLHVPIKIRGCSLADRWSMHLHSIQVMEDPRWCRSGMSCLAIRGPLSPFWEADSVLYGTLRA